MRENPYTGIGPSPLEVRSVPEALRDMAREQRMIGNSMEATTLLVAARELDRLDAMVAYLQAFIRSGKNHDKSNDIL